MSTEMKRLLKLFESDTPSLPKSLWALNGISAPFQAADFSACSSNETVKVWVAQHDSTFVTFTGLISGAPFVTTVDTEDDDEFIDSEARTAAHEVGSQLSLTDKQIAHLASIFIAELH